MFASVIISAKAAKQVKGGYPWVYVRDVLSRRFSTAGIVGVLDKRGEFLGQAFYSPSSKIVLRLITRSKVKIDKNFWVERVRAAFKRRCPGKASDTYRGESNSTPPIKCRTLNGGTLQSSDAFRVVYAESDGMPSIIIDKYNDIVSFQITSAGAETVKEDIIAAISEVLKPAAIIEKNNIAVRKLEGLPLIERVVRKGVSLRGEAEAISRKQLSSGDCFAGARNDMTTIITEGDQRFEVDVLHGQKTGAYLDYRGFRLKMRDLSLRGATATKRSSEINYINGIASPAILRQAQDERTRSDEPTAIDLFCYQGWMACHLAKSYEKVIAVDASQDAIDAARRNTELNGHKNIEFICADAFEYLRGQATFYPSSMVEKQKVACPLFDFIHLDPPPFAKGRENLPAAIKGYKKMITAALKLLKPKGVLFVSSCSHHISEGMLEKVVQEPAKVSGFKFQVIYRGIQDGDHPVLKGFPESLYLKAIAIQI